jgi:hypothetical protein
MRFAEGASSTWCRTLAGWVSANSVNNDIAVLTVLMALLARVAKQAASAIGLSPSSTSAAAQETTVGARAAMHSIWSLARFNCKCAGKSRTQFVAASCFLCGQEGLSLSLQGTNSRSITNNHRGGANSGRWRSHGRGSEDCNNGGDGELHIEGCIGNEGRSLSECRRCWLEVKAGLVVVLLVAAVMIFFWREHSQILIQLDAPARSTWIS